MVTQYYFQRFRNYQLLEILFGDFLCRLGFQQSSASVPLALRTKEAGPGQKGNLGPGLAEGWCLWVCIADVGSLSPSAWDTHDCCPLNGQWGQLLCHHCHVPRAMRPKSSPRSSSQVSSRPSSHFHQLQQEPQGHQDGAAPHGPPPAPPPTPPPAPPPLMPLPPLCRS